MRVCKGQEIGRLVTAAFANAGSVTFRPDGKALAICQSR